MNIENKKQFAMILLAIGLGLVAALLMSKVVSDKVDQQTKIIAKEYKVSSTALVKEMEATKKTLKKLSSDHAALAQKVAQQPKVIQQQQVAAPAKAPAQQVTFSLRTPPGKRAVTLRIDSLKAVGGLVNPGDFVDIIAHLNVPETEDTTAKKKASSNKVTAVLFQNIQVLAVGTNFNPMGEAPSYAAQQGAKALNVTFAVSPEEAGLLTFAEARGKLQLSLRSPAETQDKVLQEVASWSALADFVLETQGTDLRVPKKKEPVVVDVEEEEEVAPRTSIQIFRGGREL